MPFVLLSIVIVLLVVVGIRHGYRTIVKQDTKREEELRAHRQEWMNLQNRLDRITPNHKPLFSYNRLQGTWAITTFDKLTNPTADRLEIATPGGDKLLVNRTASISLFGDHQFEYEILDHLISRVLEEIMADALANGDFDSTYDLRRRLFRECDDLYVQLGTKVPPGTTRAEIERMNTKCYAPSGVWEALEADILQSIQSRTKAG